MTELNLYLRVAYVEHRDIEYRYARQNRCKPKSFPHGQGHKRSCDLVFFLHMTITRLASTAAPAHVNIQGRTKAVLWGTIAPPDITRERSADASGARLTKYSFEHIEEHDGKKSTRRQCDHPGHKNTADHLKIDRTDSTSKTDT